MVTSMTGKDLSIILTARFFLVATDFGACMCVVPTIERVANGRWVGGRSGEGAGEFDWLAWYR